MRRGRREFTGKPHMPNQPRMTALAVVGLDRTLQRIICEWFHERGGSPPLSCFSPRSCLSLLVGCLTTYVGVTPEAWVFRRPTLVSI